MSIPTLTKHGRTSYWPVAPFLPGEDPLVDVLDGKDINSIAGVLKLYFRELREPLFPTALFDELISCSSKSSPDLTGTLTLDLLDCAPSVLSPPLVYHVVADAWTAAAACLSLVWSNISHTHHPHTYFSLGLMLEAVSASHSTSSPPPLLHFLFLLHLIPSLLSPLLHWLPSDFLLFFFSLIFYYFLINYFPPLTNHKSGLFLFIICHLHVHFVQILCVIFVSF